MEPTLILRANGKTERVKIDGMPIGIQPHSTYLTKTRVLETGDTVLMATDGVTEAHHGKAFFGMEGLTELVKQAGRAISLPELCKAVYGGARDFAGGALHDDVCMLLARRP